jgi:ABC-2 type transport system permease protein
MKNVALIVGRELASYLKTPSGYVIAGVMLFFQGLVFNGYAVGDQPSLSTEVLLRFLEVSGGLTIVTGVLFSMRLLAEERANGTMTLLFTSPVREGEIVLGKYLASLAFIALVILASLYLPALIFVKGKVSYGHIACGYLGLFLLGASTLAVGTFASSLVKHPFLAVLLTGGFAAVLEATFWVARISDPDTPASTTILGAFSPYYTHFRNFRNGIVQLSDLVFFASMIYVSLLAATRVLKAQRWR